MNVGTQSCLPDRPAGWPSCMAETSVLDIIHTLFKQILTCHAYSHKSFDTTFSGLDLGRGSLGQQKAEHFGFVLSHSSQLIRMKFDVALEEFNPLLGVAWPIVYFLQGRLGTATNFMRVYQFVCPAIVGNISGVSS